MPVRIDIQRKIVVDGRQFDSVDEMPAHLREAYERSLPTAAGILSGKGVEIGFGKITLNGKEWNTGKNPEIAAGLSPAEAEPLSPESPFSGRFLLLAAGIILLLVLVYIYFGPAAK